MTDPFVERLLDETRHEIDRADTKASILLAGAGVVAGALAAGLVSGDLDPTNARGWVQALGAIAAVFLGAGVALLGMAVYPRIGKAIPGRARYFMDHAQYESLTELREAVVQEASDPTGRNLQQLFDLSKHVRLKYRYTRWGEILTAIGLVTAAGVGVLHLVIRP